MCTKMMSHATYNICFYRICLVFKFKFVFQNVYTFYTLFIKMTHDIDIHDKYTQK